MMRVAQQHRDGQGLQTEKRNNTVNLPCKATYSTAVKRQVTTQTSDCITASYQAG